MKRLAAAHWIVLAGITVVPSVSFAQVTVGVSGNVGTTAGYAVTGVPTPPPVPRLETPPPQPAPGYVWISGYWAWNGRQYGWAAGQWQSPPAGRTWVPPQWENVNGTWAMRRGEWKPTPPPAPALGVATVVQPGQPQPGVIVATAPPPAPRVDVAPPQPSPNHTWIAGYWTWNGTQYAWNPGQWQAPPQQGEVWIAPQWESNEGRGWRYRHGEWRSNRGGSWGAPEAQPQPMMQPQPQPQPVMQAQPQPQTGPIIDDAFVSTRPPAPINEQRPPQPSPNHVWVAGYWGWTGTQYAWTPGQWQMPPQPGATWVAPQWEPPSPNPNGALAGAWHFRRGEWRGGVNANANGSGWNGNPNDVYVNTPPPALVNEQRPPQPSPAHVWIAGYWNWNGSQYAWTPGQWQAPPQPGVAWVAPQWQQEGGRWRFHRGEWRAQGGAAWGQQGPQGQPGWQGQQQGQPGWQGQQQGQPGWQGQQQGQPGWQGQQQGQPTAPVVATATPPTVAPPAMPRERRGPPPGPGLAWVPGYWTWNGTAYAWTAGSWQSPPRPRARWNAPRWRRVNGMWVYAEGNWR